MARLLDTQGFAAYSAGLLVSSTFCMLGCLGLQSIVQRTMPIDLLAGRNRASFVFLIQAMGIAILGALAGSVISLTGLSVAGLSSENLRVSMLHGLSQQLFVLVTTESRSRGEPLRFSYQNLVRALLVVTGAGLSAWMSRSSTLTLLTEAVLSLIVSWRLVRDILIRARIGFVLTTKLALRRLNKIHWNDALSLMSVMIIGFMLVNMDRWIAASFLEPAMFAAYAFGWVIITASQSIQTIINSAIYPSLARRYGAHGQLASFKLACKTSLTLLSMSLIMAWPAYKILLFVVEKWFPDYAESGQLMFPFLLVATFRVSDFWSSFLIIVGRERVLLATNLFSGLMAFLIWRAFCLYIFDTLLSPVSLAFLALMFSFINFLLVMWVAFMYRRTV